MVSCILLALAFAIRVYFFLNGRCRGFAAPKLNATGERCGTPGPSIKRRRAHNKVQTGPYGLSKQTGGDLAIGAAPPQIHQRQEEAPRKFFEHHVWLWVSWRGPLFSATAHCTRMAHSQKACNTGKKGFWHPVSSQTKVASPLRKRGRHFKPHKATTAQATLRKKNSHPIIKRCED
ncbi:uncharacterized protein TM35_000331550 [Trypanosoma theileri]|uniref:Secreted protein n=1 Tax=Trypanosoma theileri TaxID=67003 RepID=A0A1X0NMH4_9TRYP|nr:uncharacterized protein TM35_000331550 [Trypanosoma theileri]ORC85698.1 hypothetical protein TM35_000331550 [Trypanosoma theileri]